MKAGTGLKWEGSLGHTLNKNVTHLLVETRHGVYSAAFLPSQVTSTTEALQFFRSNVFLIFLLNLKCVIFLLAYNCFTTLGYFLLYNKVNQLLIHVRCWCLVIQLCLTLATPWTAARQAPLSMGFSRQEYRSGLPFPPPGDLPDPGIKAASAACLLLCSQVLYRRVTHTFKCVF